VENQVRDFIVIFISIVYEALPFIVLGAVFAGFIEELVPQQLIARFVPRSPVLAIALGGLLGIVFPMCECGIIVVMRRLLRKGLPLSACIAYLLAGPIVNPIVLLSTYVAFFKYPVDQMGGPWMMILRALGGYLVATGTALVVERLHRRHGDKLLLPIAVPTAAPDPDDDAAKGKAPLLRRAGNITQTALHDFVDITAFLILGALLAAFIRQGLTHSDIEEIGRGMPVVTILVMMGLAVLLCLCSEADAFVAASFVALPGAAKLAFLVLGPMFDIKLYFMYTQVFRRRLIGTVFGTVTVLTFLFAVAVHSLWPHVAPLLGGGSSGP
jgi:hypothetical protein